MKKFQKTNEKNISKIKYYMIEIQRKREKKKDSKFVWKERKVREKKGNKRKRHLLT